MTKEEFINEIKIYDFKIIEAVQDYYLIERLVDWQNDVGNEFKLYNSTFIPVSRALHTNFVLIYTSLFDRRSKYSIEYLIDQSSKQSWYPFGMDMVFKKIKDLFEQNLTTTKNIPDTKRIKTTDIAMKWRDKVLAHNDVEGINEEMFDNLKLNYRLPTLEMLRNLCILHDYINEIRELFGLNKLLIVTKDQSLDLCMSKIFDTSLYPPIGFDFSYTDNR